jgi:hypothetical protein
MSVLLPLLLLLLLTDTNNNGLIDRILVNGARSFSIYRADRSKMGRHSVSSTVSGLTQVFDSAAQLEQLSAQLLPDVFNSEGTPDTFDGRSDNKGEMLLLLLLSVLVSSCPLLTPALSPWCCCCCCQLLCWLLVPLLRHDCSAMYTTIPAAASLAMIYNWLLVVSTHTLSLCRMDHPCSAECFV